jgi:hypothetical protein
MEKSFKTEPEKPQRLTRTSIANLKVCDSAQLVKVEHRGSTVYTVSLQRAGAVVYLCGSKSVVSYPSAVAARRAIKRIRPDIEPTEI